MGSSFDIAIKTVLANEGGLCNVGDDPGGLTNFGISQKSYPNIDIRALTPETAAAIYKRDFWHYDAVQSQAMATKIFDMSVNMGHAAIRILQTCLGITVDGLWGPGTCAAVNAAGDDLLNTYRNALSQHYQNLVLANPALAQFLKGWLRRAAQ
jgi:lysozyme family protein